MYIAQDGNHTREIRWLKLLTLMRQEGKGQEDLGFCLITKILVAQERKSTCRVCGSIGVAKCGMAQEGIRWIKKISLVLLNDQEGVVEGQEGFQKKVNAQHEFRN